MEIVFVNDFEIRLLSWSLSKKAKVRRMFLLLQFKVSLCFDCIHLYCSKMRTFLTKFTQSLEFILKKIAMFIWIPCICSIRMSINSGKGWLSRHYNIIKVTRFYSKLINNNKIINWLVNQLINILWSYSSQKHLVLNKKKVRIKGIEVLPQIQIF